MIERLTDRQRSLLEDLKKTDSYKPAKVLSIIRDEIERSLADGLKIVDIHQILEKEFGVKTTYQNLRLWIRRNLKDNSKPKKKGGATAEEKKTDSKTENPFDVFKG